MKQYIVHRTSYVVKAVLLCLLSGILLSLPFSSFNLWFLAWFGFVPLFIALKNKSKFQVFLLAYLTGVIFWLGTVYWLIHVTLLGMVVLVLFLALFFAVFGLFFSYLHTTYLPAGRQAKYFILAIPSFWVLLEYLRSHLFTGFPWALLGYSQYKVLPVIQIADITGAWGVSFLVMMVNLVIYNWVSGELWVVGKKQKIILPFSILMLVLAYGLFRLLTTHNSPPSSLQPESTIKISVIQGNIPQELKWASGAENYIVSKYALLTKEAARNGTDLIIWPEASSPGLLGEDNAIFENIFALSKEVKVPLLIGAVAVEGKDYFNSALLINKGNIEKSYSKLHLVPFGEYIPLKKLFPFLETIVPIGDITPGKEFTVFTQNPQLTTHPPIKYSVLICFEDLFPELSREFIKKGADFLINITNDAWYKQTCAPYQHLQASIFRAVENRVMVVRAANTGITCFIAPSGKINSIVRDGKGKEIFVTGYKTENINLPLHKFSFYCRYPDIFILACVLFLLYIIAKISIKSLNRRSV